jgi:hypothetical protein
MLLLEGPQTADAAADDYSGTVRVVAVACGEPRVLHRLNGGGDCILRIRVGALGFLAIHEQHRIEPLHLRSEAHRETARIKLRDGSRARLPREDRVPSRRHVVADGRDASDAGDDDPPPHQAFTFSRR